MHLLSTVRLLVPVVLLLVATVQANPIDVFGYGARGMAMGNALTAEANDIDAVMYNMGLLAMSPNAMGFGINATADDARILLRERPAGFDPEGYENRFLQRRSTKDLLNNQALMIGMKHDLGSEWFSLGFGMYFPFDPIIIQRTRYNNETEQYASNQLHFELLGEYTQRQVLKTGIGFRPLPWLGIGVGASMLQSSVTDSYVFQPNALDNSEIFITLDNQIKENFALEAGLSIQPNERLKLGLSYHGQIDYPITGQNFVNVIVDLGVFELQTLSVQNLVYSVNWTPDRYILGASYSAGPLTVSFDGAYAVWEEYQNNLAQAPPVELSNIFSPRLGVEYVHNETHALRGGYNFAESPLPTTDGRYNYVDNDRHVFTVGYGYHFPLQETRGEIAVYGQWHHLIPRTVIKDLSQIVDENPDDEFPELPGLQTGNPGFPGYTSEGDLYVFGLQFTMRGL